MTALHYVGAAGLALASFTAGLRLGLLRTRRIVNDIRMRGWD